MLDDEIDEMFENFRKHINNHATFCKDCKYCKRKLIVVNNEIVKEKEIKCLQHLNMNKKIGIKCPKYEESDGDLEILMKKFRRTQI